jgi:transcriptional regulator with XRE-family HTH domain
MGNLSSSWCLLKPPSASGPCWRRKSSRTAYRKPWKHTSCTMCPWPAHLGLTQQAVCKRAGLLQPALARIESGSKPRKATLEKLAAAMGITAEQLLGGVQEAPAGGSAKARNLVGRLKSTSKGKQLESDSHCINRWAGNRLPNCSCPQARLTFKPARPLSSTPLHLGLECGPHIQIAD